MGRSPGGGVDLAIANQSAGSSTNVTVCPEDKLESILIRGARQLLTLRGPKGLRHGSSAAELHIIQDGAALIRDGVLVEVGPSRRVENLAEARGAIEVNAAGRVVMPGFVDAHTHLVYPCAGVNGQDRYGAARAIQTATGQRLEQRAKSYLQAMARHGTTTVEVKTGAGLDESAEAKLLRVVSALRNDPLDLIPAFLFRPAPALDGASLPATVAWMVDEFLPRIRRRGVRFADARWDGDAETLPYLDQYLQRARALGFSCRVHAEQADVEAAIRLGIRHQLSSIDHLEEAGPAEVRQLAEAGILATLLPCAAAGAVWRQAPARAMLDSGIAIALGTDFNPQDNPALNMQMVVAMACLRAGMRVEEAIVAATINGAYALGCGDTAGSLEPGKIADVLILNASHYQDLRNGMGTNLVHLTMKRGRFIYQEGDVAPRSTNVRLPHH